MVELWVFIKQLGSVLCGARTSISGAVLTPGSGLGKGEIVSDLVKRVAALLW